MIILSADALCQQLGFGYSNTSLEETSSWQWVKSSIETVKQTFSISQNSSSSSVPFAPPIFSLMYWNKEHK